MLRNAEAAMEELLILQRALLDSDDATDDLSTDFAQPDYRMRRKHSTIGNECGPCNTGDNFSQKQVIGKCVGLANLHYLNDFKFILTGTCKAGSH